LNHYAQDRKGATANSNAASSCSVVTHCKSPVPDKSNTFEENIDFAAYLNLDRFEKGSLMGGQPLEASPLKSSRFEIVL